MKKLFQKAVVINFMHVEIIWTIAFVIICLFSFIQMENAPMNISYIPSAITGLTTFSGILTAFVGFWLTRQNNNPGDEQTRKWMRAREEVIVLTLVFGLLLIAGGLTSLIYRPIEFAFQVSILGTLIIIWAIGDVLFFEAFSSINEK